MVRTEASHWWGQGIVLSGAVRVGGAPLSLAPCLQLLWTSHAAASAWLQPTGGRVRHPVPGPFVFGAFESCCARAPLGPVVFRSNPVVSGAVGPGVVWGRWILLCPGPSDPFEFGTVGCCCVQGRRLLLCPVVSGSVRGRSCPVLGAKLILASRAPS